MQVLSLMHTEDIHWLYRGNLRPSSWQEHVYWTLLLQVQQQTLHTSNTSENLPAGELFDFNAKNLCVGSKLHSYSMFTSTASLWLAWTEGKISNISDSIYVLKCAVCLRAWFSLTLKKIFPSKARKKGICLASQLGRK